MTALFASTSLTSAATMLALAYADLVQADNTSSVWDTEITIGDLGAEAIIRLTMTSENGSNFRRIDANTRLAIMGGNNAHVEVGEPVRFTASLVSRDASVAEVGFALTSLGIRPEGAVGDRSMAWTSSLTPVAVSYEQSKLEIDYSMDDGLGFQDLAVSSYTGTFEVTGGQVKLSNFAPASGIGLSYEITALPEPATAALSVGVVVLCVVLGGRRHKRRH